MIAALLAALSGRDARHRNRLAPGGLRGEAAFYVADRLVRRFRDSWRFRLDDHRGSATLVCAALVHRHGLAGIWLDLSGAIGLLLLALLPRGPGAANWCDDASGDRRKVLRHGRRTAAGVLVAVAEMVWLRSLIEASQTVLTTMTGPLGVPALLVSAAVFIGYTAIGGQYAVIRTDFVQYGLMVAGILVVGTSASLAALHGRLSPPADALAFPVSPTLPWRDVFAWLLLIGLPHLVGGDVYAKLLSCRDERSARLAAAGAAASKLAFGAAVAVIALSARQSSIPVGDADRALPAALAAFAPGVWARSPPSLRRHDAVVGRSVLLTGADDRARRSCPLWASPGNGCARALVLAFGALGLLIALKMREIVETPEARILDFRGRNDPSDPLRLLPADMAPGAVRGRGDDRRRGDCVAGRFFPGLAFHRDPAIAGTAVTWILPAGFARTRVAGCPGDEG
jgi:hypothetical protein